MEGISQPHPTPNICLLSSSLLPRPGAKAKQTLNLAAPRADRAMEEPPKEREIKRRRVRQSESSRDPTDILRRGEAGRKGQAKTQRC